MDEKPMRPEVTVELDPESAPARPAPKPAPAGGPPAGTGETLTGGRRWPLWAAVLLSAVFAAFNYTVYAGRYNSYLAVAAAVGMVILLAVGDLRRLKNAPALLLLGYGAYTLISIFWAMSGKFFLREYSKLAIAIFFFLLAMFWRRADRHFVRGVMGMIAGASAVFALASIEGATSGHLKQTLLDFANVGDGGINLSSIRLSGVFGNANVESSVYAVGVFFSLPLVCGGETKPRRAVAAAALSLNMLGFLLVCSLGAMACFAVALPLYLVFAGKGRYAALLRMLETALPTLAVGFLVVRIQGGEQRSLIPLLALASAALSAVLELAVAGRLTAALEQNKALARRVLLAVAVLVLAYFAAGLLISQPHTFGGGLRRSAVLTPGEHTLEVEVQGEVNVSILSKNTEQIMAGGSTGLYSGPAAGAVFTVPEDSSGCDLTFTGEGGAVLSSVTIDGRRYFNLKYPLFPDFAMNRIQPGLITGDSFVLRYILWQNGLELFGYSPVIGHGMGAFETGITRVQDFYFATRYVHSHYIQVLLEGGIIGFLLFAGGVAALGVCLWKKRRPERGDERFWVYPALCAEFVMVALHMLWDVFMSYYAFLVCFWLFAALVIHTCALPEAVRVSAPTKEQRRRMLPGRLAGMACALFLGLSVAGNLYVKRLLGTQFDSAQAAFSGMERAVDLDLYERNDVMLTYILTELSSDEAGVYREQADRYAERLSRVQSNQLPYYLAAYYFNTERYDRCLDEAILSATYSVSDASMWNQMAGILKQGFTDPGFRSPLVASDPDGALLAKLVQYRQMLLDYNAASLKPIALNEESRQFFDTVGDLEQAGNKGEMIDILAGDDW